LLEENNNQEAGVIDKEDYHHDIEGGAHCTIVEQATELVIKEDEG
jgi:hypothetical protein